MRYSPFLSCRQASRLITARMDRPLGPLERIELALHLRICDTCPIVVRQLDLLRVSIHEWRDTAERDWEQT
ncbi:MAG: zf-HC2 domain-containing protein [Burkholderiaceae bacterium]